MSTIRAATGPEAFADVPCLDASPSCELPTPCGTFTLYGVREGNSKPEHAVLTFAALGADATPVVRVNSECLSGDGLFSLPDQRDYGYCAEILRGYGIRRLRLLTNNPSKTAALRRLGLEVVEEIPLVAGENAFDRRYLDTKAQCMGHRLQRSASGTEQES